MTSHSSGKSSTLKPFRPKSLTLLNETGNVEIYRVSEEMRKKVEEDSRRIHQLNLDNNYKSRKMTKRNEHKRLKVDVLFAVYWKILWLMYSPFSLLAT